MHRSSLSLSSLADGAACRADFAITPVGPPPGCSGAKVDRRILPLFVERPVLFVIALLQFSQRLPVGLRASSAKSAWNIAP